MEAFNETLKSQDGRTIIADLMVEAGERVQRKQRSHEAIARILERRNDAPTITEEEFRIAREGGRR